MANNKPTNGSRLKIVLISTSILLVVLAAMAALTISNNQQTAAAVQVNQAIETDTVKQKFNEGFISHFVSSYANIQTVEMKRGETLVVPITIQHLSKNLNESVTVGNFHNEVRNFMPSAYKGMTSQQFLDYIENANNAGSILPGEINVNNFITFSQPSVTLIPNSTGTVLLTISLPANLPDETVGRSLEIGLGYDIQSHNLSIAGSAGIVTVKVIS